MAVKIGSARIDENGRAHGGKAGDNNKKEVSTQNWYKHGKGWVLIRPKDSFEAERIAQAMEAACANDNIGYDQYQRLTLYNAAKPKGFNPALVTEKCETDCSALVRVCCAYAGIMTPNFRTTDEVKVLKKTGRFDILTDPKYTTQSLYLKRGDILCTKVRGHTVVVLTDGSKVEYSNTQSLGNRVLTKGNRGNDVKALQAALMLFGYNLSKYGTDGDFGSETEAALKEFQSDIGLDPTGIGDMVTIRAIVDKAAQGWTKQTARKLTGIIPDVSANQGKINFDKFCPGCDFAIFRARVAGKNDAKFKTWATEMMKRGFRFGVYDFVKLKSEADAIKQAEAMYKLCSPFNPTVYYLDTEKLADGITYAKERPFIKAYVKRLRELGVKKVGQYTGDYRWRSQYYRLEDQFDTLWVANWGQNNGKTGGTLKSQSDKIHLQQYTSYGYTRGPGAPGIDHRIDMNKLTGKVPISYFTEADE